MANISQTPVYNLKAVLRETGLKADVLRAWERRYDLPKPQRSAGGHRLYSDYDIEIVKWLKARQAEGLGISRAVELWKEIRDEGRDPLKDYSLPSASPTVEIDLPGDTRLEALRREWLEAGMAFDSNRAEEILNLAFAIYPVETICTEIFQKGLSSVGTSWYLSQASVQQEHFISAMVVHRLETLIAAAPHPTRNKTILIGCPPGEWHTFSILLLHLMLRRRGFKVIYLGADVPIFQMAETASEIQPDLIIMASQQITTVAALRSAALSLQRLAIPLAYGGLIFNRVPGLRGRIPGHFLGENLVESINQVEKLVIHPQPSPGTDPIDERHQITSRRFREKHAQIEGALLRKLREAEFPVEYIDEVNTYFSNRVSAALELGDLSFLEADLDWVKRLLSGRRLATNLLIPYLSTWFEVVDREMGKDGALITAWLSAYLSQGQPASQSPVDL